MSIPLKPKNQGTTGKGSMQSSKLQILRVKLFPYLRENGKMIIQSVFTIFFIGVGIWFFEHERTELGQIRSTIEWSDKYWIGAGILLFLFYVLLQALMYNMAFRSVNSKINFTDAILLFLKRNFISVFLPAGGVSSLAFFSGALEKKGIKQTHVHLASSIYGFVGILTVVMVAIPVFIIFLFNGNSSAGVWLMLIVVSMLLASIIFIYRSILIQGSVYKIASVRFPSLISLLDEIKENRISKRYVFLTILISLVIELTGVLHIIIAARALQLNIGWLAAFDSYVVSVLFLIISPFLRGLGAIEFSMSYLLVHFGLSNVEAVSTTLLYRFFEFWLPLILGACSFLIKINRLLMRIFPALLLLGMGAVNIISAITPAIHERFVWVKNFIPLELMHVSNYFVLISGMLMLITSAFLLKGLRLAWWFAVILCIISVVGNIFKAFDYEEASFAVFIIAGLIITRKEYVVKTDPSLRNFGLQTSLISMGAVIVYGVIGFYFLDKKYFNIDFSFLQSLRYTIENYFLIGSSDLVTTHPFAENFILSIKICGFLSILFLVVTLIKPFYMKQENLEEIEHHSRQLIKNYGTSALDYFKLYSDKQIYLAQNKQAFLSYRIVNNYAVILENPVAENADELKNCVVEFDKFCITSGLRSIFYRVPEETLKLYTNLKKKTILLGQEAVVNLDTFSLTGGSKKSIRNAIKKLEESGYKSKVYQPPVMDGVLQKIKSVSDEWLFSKGRNEIVFSQGMFVWDELKQQTIITVENSEERVIAFLNIIPDYAEGEATYDLMRNINNAPNGTIDFLMIKMFENLKSRNCHKVNLGFVAMSGIQRPENISEKSMKFAYEKIKSFSHYKGMREYKDKFDPEWFNKYLVYSHDYDLLQLPLIMSKVIKPY